MIKINRIVEIIEMNSNSDTITVALTSCGVFEKVTEDSCFILEDEEVSDTFFDDWDISAWTEEELLEE
jgi:hypothetical protein